MDAVAQAKMLHSTFAVGAHNAITVCIVHNKRCVVFIGKVSHIGQGRKVAVHAEYTVCDDKPFAGYRFFQLCFEGIHIHMLENFDFRAGKTASVDDAAVVKLIAVNGIAFADKAGDYAGICGNAAVENERCLYILEFCEFFL